MNALKYAEWAKHYDPEQKEILCLASHGINFEGKRILEVGCGTGRFTERILPNCTEIHCIDPDEKNLDILRVNLCDSRLNISCGTLDTVSIKQNYYDYVIFSWSMYLVEDKEQNLVLAYNALNHNGCVIILQANSGEYEEEIAQLYSNYNSLSAYQTAYNSLPDLVKKTFGNVECDIIHAYFYFDSIEQIIESSLFFIEDEEGHTPSKEAIDFLRKRLVAYITVDGKVKLSDNVSLFIAKKGNSNE